MSLSYYFEDLIKAYRAELDDLQSDSEGKNVLSTRLKQKRSQFAQLMPMIDTAPEMVAVVFHNHIIFQNAQVMAQLVASEPEEFPSWDELSAVISFEPAAEKLVKIVLAESGGELFLITTACLEYLVSKTNGRSASAQADDDSDERDDDDKDGRTEEGDDEGEDMAENLDEASADWLAEQGFDRRE